MQVQNLDEIDSYIFDGFESEFHNPKSIVNFNQLDFIFIDGDNDMHLPWCALTSKV